MVIDPEATAILVEAGRIAAIGDDRAVLTRRGNRVQAVDLQGAIIAPGLIDSHIHAFDCAMGSLTVSLLPPGVDSLAVLKQRLAAKASSSGAGEWILGEGYDDMRIAELRHPNRLDLDEAVPDLPAIAGRVCGHMSVANTVALTLAGIDRDTPDPEGGTIVRDAAGTPTGLLLEQAQALVTRLVPAPDADRIVEALHRTGRALVAFGVTTICEAFLGGFDEVQPSIWRRVLSQGWEGPTVGFLADHRSRETSADAGLPVIGTKLFADGVVTGRTAALSEPFENDGGTGMLIHEPEALVELVRDSADRGFPVGIHAMGDRGIATAVDVIERVMATTSEDRLLRMPGRYRIEHCTLPDGTSIDKMRTLGIVPVPQPGFLFAEGEAYRIGLGEERCRRAYPLRTFIERGLRPALSSDAPATSSDDAINPWLGIRAAVTRTTWAGSELGATEAISLPEAIACHTANGAAAMSREERTGSVALGKDADVVVFREDPLSVPPERLDAVRPEIVLIKGRPVVWPASGV